MLARLLFRSNYSQYFRTRRYDGNCYKTNQKTQISGSITGYFFSGFTAELSNKLLLSYIIFLKRVAF